MTESDILAGWSAALAALFAGAGWLAGLRSWDLARMGGARRRAIVMASFAILAAGLAIRYGVATEAWINERWSGPIAWFALLERALESIGAVMFGGVAAWERCGHRGWIGLVLLPTLIWAGVAMAAAL